MPTEQLILTILTAIVALLGLVVSFATWLSKTKEDSGKQDAEHAVVVTKLDGISDVQKETREEVRRLMAKIDEVDHTAHHALERAEAAHNRLDRAGIDKHE